MKQFALSCLVLIGVVGCTGGEQATTFKVQGNGILIEGAVKPGSKVTAKEYKAGLNSVVKKK